VPADDNAPVLVAGARTPIGRFGGALATCSAVELGAAAVGAAVDRAPGLAVDYVVLGNVVAAGNGQNPARAVAARAGLPLTVPALTVNDVCLASMTSLGLAATLIRTGEIRGAVVGGFESMSQAPHAVRVRGAASVGDGTLVDLLVRDGLWCALALRGMGELSDAENTRLGIPRYEQDDVALASHRRAAEATAAQRLAAEIVPVGGTELTVDEGIRTDTSLDALRRLRPAFTTTGTITAGNAAQLSDAAAAGIVASRGEARASGREPLAEIVGRDVVAGPDPALHLKPAAAARRLLDRYGLGPDDVDLWEVNEAFAGVVVATARELGLDPARVNVNGGAIALGHPLGASGFRIVLTLALEMRRRDAELGVAAICGGGGQGQAVLLRRG